jgi:RNA polymerase sigma factor (sigma-70 family)
MALSREREYELIRCAQNGETEAEDELIVAFQPLIRSIAADLLRDWNLSAPGLFDDLESEGAIALLEKIRGFDLNTGNRLSTYAYPRIFGAMHNWLARQRLLRPPNSLLQRGHAVEQVYWTLAQQLQREPTIDEVAAEMELPIHKVETAMACLDVVYFSIEAHGEAFGSHGEPESEEDSPGEILLRAEEEQLLHEAMATELNHTEIVAIRLHYWYGLKYEEIAWLLGRTVGAVKQLMRRAKKKLEERLETTETEVR